MPKLTRMPIESVISALKESHNFLVIIKDGNKLLMAVKHEESIMLIADLLFSNPEIYKQVEEHIDLLRASLN